MTCIRICATVYMLSWAVTLAGCKHLPPVLQDNEGSTLTTASSEPLRNVMFIGKWDLDGKRTNEANGKTGLGALGPNIAIDMLGTGWKFEPGGLLRTDTTLGPKTGWWRVRGGNELQIKEAGQVEPLRFLAGFRDGFMYLQDTEGKWLVFELNKFFGW